MKPIISCLDAETQLCQIFIMIPEELDEKNYHSFETWCIYILFGYAHFDIVPFKNK